MFGLLADTLETGGAGAAGGVLGAVIMALIGLLKGKYNAGNAPEYLTREDLKLAIKARQSLVDKDVKQLTDRLDRHAQQFQALEGVLHDVRDSARDSARELKRLADQS